MLHILRSICHTGSFMEYYDNQTSSFSGGPYLIDPDYEGNTHQFRQLGMIEVDMTSDSDNRMLTTRGTSHSSRNISQNSVSFNLQADLQISSSRSKGICEYGVYWILAESFFTTSCNTACNEETSPTSCAGDYPTFIGWPYDTNAARAIIKSLNPITYPIATSCQLNYTIGLDDNNPDIYYRNSGQNCIVYLLDSKVNYTCAATVGGSKAHRMCPCCIKGEGICLCK